MSYIGMRGRWCNIIFLNVHATNEEKSDDSKERFLRGIRSGFYHLPKYRMKFPLGDFNAKVGIVKICKPTIRNESLHRDTTDNGVKIVNYAT
jgi:hypothetical protein